MDMSGNRIALGGKGNSGCSFSLARANNIYKDNAKVVPESVKARFIINGNLVSPKHYLTLKGLLLAS